VLRRLRFVRALAVLSVLHGCGGSEDAQTQDTQGTVEPSASEGADVSAAIEAATSGSPAELVALLQRAHADVRGDLGAHRLEATTDFEVAATESPPALPPVDSRFTVPRSVHDELRLTWLPPADDDRPRFSLGQSNDHDRGRDVIAVDGHIYTRLPHRPWLRRDLDTDLHERWLDDAYRSVGDVVELAAPQLDIVRAGTRTVDGREGVVLELTRADTPRNVERPGDPRASWRAAARILEVEGELVVDAGTGAWLNADIAVKYAITAEHGAQLRGSVHVRAGLAPLERLPAIEAPADAIAYPERRRLDLERDELLDGLATP